jgi:GH24 family phage-related lysozyme (muramidase)
MIRLRSLLEDITTNKPKVLFIGDATLKKNYNFANKLIHSKRIKPNSKIKIKSNGTSEDLLNILEDNVKNHYDLFVFFVTHIRTNNIMGLIENFQLAINTAHAHNSKIVVFTLPSIKFIRDTKKTNSEREKSNRHDVNTWIRLNSNADFIIDTELELDDSVYFDSTGAEFNVEGHSFIYKQLLKIVNEINIDTDIDDTKTLDVKQKLLINASDIKEIKQIHQLLLAAGYYIDKNELTNNIIGKTTKLAILKYNSNINKRQSDDTDTQSDTGLIAVTPSIVSGDFSADVVKQAYELILKYEGFNATAKWDKTNWRIGHGSSTITKPDGTVVTLSNNKAVKPNITITEEDAERDLKRRLNTEFIPLTKKSLGSAASKFNNATIAAITSVCYNYGRVPASVISAAQSGNATQVAEAIAALSANKARRQADIE